MNTNSYYDVVKSLKLEGKLECLTWDEISDTDKELLEVLQKQEFKVQQERVELVRRCKKLQVAGLFLGFFLIAWMVFATIWMYVINAETFKASDGVLYTITIGFSIIRIFLSLRWLLKHRDILKTLDNELSVCEVVEFKNAKLGDYSLFADNLIRHRVLSYQGDNFAKQQDYFVFARQGSVPWIFTRSAFDIPQLCFISPNQGIETLYERLILDR